MQKHPSDSVIDVSPWPGGLGFRDASVWWDYVHRQSEQSRLNLMLMIALLSEGVCQLLLRHDLALYRAFSLSPQLIDLLLEIDEPNLRTFVEALLLKSQF